MRPRLALGILAGGRGERFGGCDKGWIERAGRSQIEHVIEALAPHATRILISANRNLQRYRALGAEVIEDEWPGFHGPMAGLASLFKRLDGETLLCVPVDVHTLPADFVPGMLSARGDEVFHSVLAQDDDGLQPLIALYPAALGAHARESFESGRRSVREWQHRFPVYACRFEGHRFGNLNSPADLTP